MFTYLVLTKEKTKSRFVFILLEAMLKTTCCQPQVLGFLFAQFLQYNDFQVYEGQVVRDKHRNFDFGPKLTKKIL